MHPFGKAETLTVCDFENYEIGQKLSLWNRYGDNSTSTATVIADPSNPGNKVLHVTLTGWNDYIEFQLPSDVAGKALNDKFASLTFDFCRAGGENYKQMHIFLGSDMLYGDDNYIDQGEEGKWHQRSYTLGVVPDENSSSLLHIGLNSSATEYYIDNITLIGKYDDYQIFNDGILNFSDPSSTSANYTKFATNINIPTETELNVYTSRYTYWMSNIIGSGTLNLYGGGERSYIGNEKGAAYPDWSGFDGDIHIYPWPEVNPSVKAGSYGFVLSHGNKKFDSDNIKKAISDGGYASFMENNNVTIHDGATVTAESNNTPRAFRIGHLTTETGSTINGYYKSKAGYRVYYIVGSSNKDSELAGKIASIGESKVGIIKEGTGTYRITGNENNITGTLSIIEGRVLIENDIEAAKTSKLPGAVGTSTNSAVAVAVYPGAVLGGTGNIAGLTDVYGKIEPGSSIQPGTLLIKDFVNGTSIDLRVRPTSRLRFKVKEENVYDQIDISGNLCYYNIDENLQQSDKNPILEIKLPEQHSLKIGDKFTLIKASGRSSLNNVEWAFRIQYPKAYTWEVKEINSETGYSVVAEVTSLEYSGQGDTVYDDDIADNVVDNSKYLIDYSSDFSDNTPMRTYADRAGKGLGMAVAVWRGYLEDQTKSNVISSHFNMVVAENCMKFDAIHPQRDEYNFPASDGLVDFAARNNMQVRGHTLVWHNQVPGWISSDGKKNSHNYGRTEMLEIMNSHISTVMGRYKSRVREWDVVNECLDDDQSIVRDNPDAFNLRTSVWQLAIGEDYIEKAFEYAHAADPDAHLYLNDYGVEFMGEPKSEAFYNLAKSLVEKGVPLYGVGLQCHLTVGELNADKLVANIRRYEQLGLKCIVTELDIAQDNPASADAAKRQAEEYCEVVNAALAEPNCPTVMIWGLTDPDSWRKNNPLLFDGNMQPKESFYAVHGAVRTTAEKSSILDPIEDESEIIREEYYNIQGVRVANPSNGIFIKHTTYSNGKTKATKQIVR